MISLKGTKKKRKQEIRDKTFKGDKTKCVVHYCNCWQPIILVCINKQLLILEDKQYPEQVLFWIFYRVLKSELTSNATQSGSKNKAQLYIVY